LLLITLSLGILIKRGFTGKVVENDKKIKIGVILPLTGSASYFGEEAKNGIKMAIKDLEEINVEAIYEDSKCDPLEGISSYNKLVNVNGVGVIVGPFCSSVVLTLAPLAEKDKILILTPGAAAKDISDSGDYIFRNHVLMTQKTGLIGRYSSIFYRKAAIIYDSSNDAFVDGADAFQKEFNMKGNEVVAIETFKNGDVDFRTQINNIKSKSPEVLYIGGFSPEALLIIRQINELKLDVQIVTDDAVIDPSFLESVEELGEGLVFSTTMFSEDSSPDFFERYSGEFGRNPSIFAAQAYDSLMIIGEIIKKECKNADSTCIKNELYKIQDYNGVAGVTSFDENGDALKPLILKTIRNRKPIPYEDIIRLN